MITFPNLLTWPTRSCHLSTKLNRLSSHALTHPNKLSTNPKIFKSLFTPASSSPFKLILYKKNKMKSRFPNSAEQLVASALLLLSSFPSCGTKANRDVNYSENLLLSKSLSRSTVSSTVSSDDVYSSDEAQARGLRMVTSSVACFDREFKFEVVRKSRSRTLWLSDCRKKSSAIVVSERSGSSCLTSEGSSCLSGGSSSLVSSSRSMVLSSKSRELRIRRGRKVVRDVKMQMKMKKKQSFYMVNSAHLLRRSEAILDVLGCIGCASEVRIRKLLGDSPDTSKALRMLLRKKEVRRSGAGGKIDPFIYQIAAK